MPRFKVIIEIDAPDENQAQFLTYADTYVYSKIVKLKGHSTKAKRCYVVRNGKYYAFKEIVDLTLRPDGKSFYHHVWIDDKSQAVNFHNKRLAKKEIQIVRRKEGLKTNLYTLVEI
jgi:hypothetical protein